MWKTGNQIVLNVENLLNLNYRRHITPFSPLSVTGGAGSLSNRQVFKPGRVVMFGLRGPIRPFWEWAE